MRYILPSARFAYLELILFLMVITGACGPRVVVTTEEVDEMIKTQVPVGSDKQQVKAFIDNLKIDSLKIIREGFHNALREPMTYLSPEKREALRFRIAEFIGAVIVDAETWPDEDIAIEFYIDKDGRMIDYTVKRVGTE